VGSVQEGDKAPNPSDPSRSSQPPRASQPPRPSQAPRSSTPPAQPWKGAWRIAFAFAWVATQVVLVITADRRPDGAFGFRMFAESSTVKITLYREVVGEDGQRKRIHLEDGVWSARDAGGLKRRFAWTDRVRRRELATFETEISSKYGTNAQLTRLQAALDDVATHTPDDADTRRFLLDVVVRKNGREPYVVHLASAERAAGGS
jgi:hypothetical protein